MRKWWHCRSVKVSTRPPLGSQGKNKKFQKFSVIWEIYKNPFPISLGYRSGGERRTVRKSGDGFVSPALRNSQFPTCSGKHEDIHPCAEEHDRTFSWRGRNRRKEQKNRIWQSPTIHVLAARRRGGEGALLRSNIMECKLFLPLKSGDIFLIIDRRRRTGWSLRDVLAATVPSGPGKQRHTLNRHGGTHHLFQVAMFHVGWFRKQLVG